MTKSDILQTKLKIGLSKVSYWIRVRRAGLIEGIEHWLVSYFHPRIYWRPRPKNHLRSCSLFQIMSQVYPTFPYGSNYTGKKLLLFRQISTKQILQDHTGDISAASQEGSFPCIFKQDEKHLHYFSSYFSITTQSHFVWESQCYTKILKAE